MYRYKQSKGVHPELETGTATPTGGHMPGTGCAGPLPRDEKMFQAQGPSSYGPGKVERPHRSMPFPTDTLPHRSLSSDRALSLSPTHTQASPCCCSFSFSHETLWPPHASLLRFCKLLMVCARGGQNQGLNLWRLLAAATSPSFPLSFLTELLFCLGQRCALLFKHNTTALSIISLSPNAAGGPAGGSRQRKSDAYPTRTRREPDAPSWILPCSVVRSHRDCRVGRFPLFL